LVNRSTSINIPLKNNTEIENKTNQTIPFHCSTFLPSRGLKGNKLNVASNRLTRLIKPIIVPQNPMLKKIK